MLVGKRFGAQIYTPEAAFAKIYVDIFNIIDNLIRFKMCMEYASVACGRQEINFDGYILKAYCSFAKES